MLGGNKKSKYNSKSNTNSSSQSRSNSSDDSNSPQNRMMQLIFCRTYGDILKNNPSFIVFSANNPYVLEIFPGAEHCKNIIELQRFFATNSSKKNPLYNSEIIKSKSLINDFCNYYITNVINECKAQQEEEISSNQITWQLSSPPSKITFYNMLMGRKKNYSLKYMENKAKFKWLDGIYGEESCFDQFYENERKDSTLYVKFILRVVGFESPQSYANHVMNVQYLVNFGGKVNFTVMASKPISKDVFVSFYSGKVIEKVSEEASFIAFRKDCGGNYAKYVHPGFAINVEEMGNYSRFYSDLPTPKTLKVLCSTYVQYEFLITEEGGKSKILTANLKRYDIPGANRRCSLAKKSISVLFCALVASRNIKKGEILGFPYGLGYWKQIGLLPCLFRKSDSEVLNPPYTSLSEYKKRGKEYMHTSIANLLNRLLRRSCIFSKYFRVFRRDEYTYKTDVVLQSDRLSEQKLSSLKQCLVKHQISFFESDDILVLNNANAPDSIPPAATIMPL